MAIQHADAVLNWYECYSREEMPPEWMWPFPEELERHFDNVEEQRKARASGDEPMDRADDDMMGSRR